MKHADAYLNDAESLYLPAERQPKSVIDQKVARISHHPLMYGLLSTASGLLAILDANRQIISINDAFLYQFGIKDPDDALGLRPGEILGCKYAQEMPGGCGTSSKCPTCGLVIAFLLSQSERRAADSKCAIAMPQGDSTKDLFFDVHIAPVTVEDETYFLAFLRDITLDQSRAAIEEMFFHDLTNLVSGIVGAAEMLNYQSHEDPELEKYGKWVAVSAERILKEIQIQQLFLNENPVKFEPKIETVIVQRVFEDLEKTFHKHPAMGTRILSLTWPNPALMLQTDFTLLLRILINMLKNAFEAAEPGETVRLWVDESTDSVTFNVWNAQVLPTDVQARIFTRNFSTKANQGRGIGTYSMKVLGEDILKGKVCFHSSPDAGTVFQLVLGRA